MGRKKYDSPMAVIRMLAVEDVIRTSGETLGTEIVDGHYVNPFNLGWLNFGG